MVLRLSRLACVLTAVLGLLYSSNYAVAASWITHATRTPAPNSMAALGDSITRGFNVCGWYQDCTSYSWSTGDSDESGSHYQRLWSLNEALHDNAYNFAKTGATSAALPHQAATAATHSIDYITILIGANDACQDTEAQMTPVETFRSNIDAALATLQRNLPQARIFIASVPNLHQLWSIGRDSFAARSAWGLLGLCRTMLASPNSDAPVDTDRRARVHQRVVDYNVQLDDACADYGQQCRFDGGAVFDIPFTTEHISKWDYFHPNAAGQQALAQATYQMGFSWQPVQ